MLNLVQRHLIECQMSCQRPNVPRLPADDLRRHVSDNAGTVNARLRSVPTKSSSVCEMPQTLPPRFRAVRNSCTTSGASTLESSSDQHSSRTVMLCWPLLPDARSCMRGLSSCSSRFQARGSSLNLSTLKNSQSVSVFNVVC